MRLSPFPWLIDACIDWLAIAASMTLAVAIKDPGVWIVAILVIGNRQHALGVLGHDGAHKLISRNRRVNDALTAGLCLWPLMTGLSAYRRFHFAHHRWLGTEHDPELVDLEGWSRWEYKTPASNLKIVLLFFADLCGYGIAFTIKASLLIGKKGFWDWIGPILWWGTVGGLCLFMGLWQVPVLWFAASITSLPAFFRLRIWTEHRGANGGTPRRVFSRWEQAIFLPHNTWLHYEHHAASNVPYWQLPDLRFKTRKRSAGSGSFH